MPRTSSASDVEVEEIIEEGELRLSPGTRRAVELSDVQNDNDNDNIELSSDYDDEEATGDLLQIKPPQANLPSKFASHSGRKSKHRHQESRHGQSRDRLKERDSRKGHEDGRGHTSSKSSGNTRDRDQYFGTKGLAPSGQQDRLKSERPKSGVVDLREHLERDRRATKHHEKTRDGPREKHNYQHGQPLLNNSFANQKQQVQQHSSKQLPSTSSQQQKKHDGASKSTKHPRLGRGDVSDETRRVETTQERAMREERERRKERLLMAEREKAKQNEAYNYTKKENEDRRLKREEEQRKEKELKEMQERIAKRSKSREQQQQMQLLQQQAQQMLLQKVEKGKAARKVDGGSKQQLKRSSSSSRVSTKKRKTDDLEVEIVSLLTDKEDDDEMDDDEEDSDSSSDDSDEKEPPPKEKKSKSKSRHKAKVTKKAQKAKLKKTRRKKKKVVESSSSTSSTDTSSVSTSSSDVDDSEGDDDESEDADKVENEKLVAAVSKEPELSEREEGERSGSDEDESSKMEVDKTVKVEERIEQITKSKHDSDSEHDEIHRKVGSGDERTDDEGRFVDSPLRSPVELKEELPPYLPALQGCRSVEEFRCLNRIEEGTYGVVYRAKDKRTDEVVALKKLKMEKEKEGFPITSLREINTLLKAQHPNIVTVREIVVGSNMDKIYIVMDYVEHDLKALMDTMTSKNQVFLPGEVKCLMIQLLRAIAHLHDNWILHRDIKTSNLLLSHQGILKVGDFGLAREYGSPLKNYTSVVVTLWYRAPEVILCPKLGYSTPIDLWSVGCVFGELLTMGPMFMGKSEIDQLNKIFMELGTPSEKIWPGYKDFPLVQKTAFAEYPINNLRKKFGAMLTELGMDMLMKFLTYDPAKRVTAEQALRHEYFREQPLPIDPSMFPTWPAKSEMPAKKGPSSPKAPSGGKNYKELDETDEEVVNRFHMRGLGDGGGRPGAGGGFSLKF